MVLYLWFTAWCKSRFIAIVPLGNAALCENRRVGMRGRHRRALRGTLAAAAATFVALTSHILGGGAFPSATGIIVPLTLSTLVCVLVSGRRLSLPRLTISVGISQTLFHLLFSLFTPIASGALPTACLDAIGRRTRSAPRFTFAACVDAFDPPRADALDAQRSDAEDS